MLILNKIIMLNLGIIILSNIGCHFESLLKSARGAAAVGRDLCDKPSEMTNDIIHIKYFNSRRY